VPAGGGPAKVLGIESGDLTAHRLPPSGSSQSQTV
jgi:hypothetical protein